MNITDAHFIVVDVETTGLEPKTDKIVELGATATNWQNVLGMWATLVDPEIPIPAETMGVHGITDAMVKGAPVMRDAADGLMIFTTMLEGEVMVAHNAAFDEAFVEGEDKSSWLCTKRMAQHLWPDAPNHKLQTLRYWLNLKFDDFGVSAHRTLGDTIVTAALLRKIIDKLDIETDIITVGDLLAFSNKPILYTTWWFGKYYAQPIIAPDGRCDRGYIKWALEKKEDLDDDQRWSLEQALTSKPEGAML